MFYYHCDYWCFAGKPRRRSALGGDTLLDGTTLLAEINGIGGVAINIFGEVTFHGRTDMTDAVLVAEVVQVVDLPADGDESSTE